MSRNHLRAVGDNTPALDDDELHKRGNEIVTKAREAAITAIGKSMQPDFVQRGQSLGRSDILRWRFKAREAIAAWRECESLLTELIGELDKKSAEFRSTHTPKAVTDDGVHYRTEWVRKDEETK